MSGLACGVEFEGLLLEQRRGTLSDANREKLSRHLVDCPTCRLSRRLALDCDVSCESHADDSLRIANAANHAIAVHRRVRLSPASRPLRTLALAASFVLVAGGVASAAYWVVKSRTTGLPHAEEQVPTRGSLARVPAHSAGLANSSEPTPGEAEPEASLTEPSEKEPSPARLAGKPMPTPQPVARSSAFGRSRSAARATALSESKSSVAAVTASVDKSALFGMGNEARRKGDATRAEALYRELQQRFPDSREARLSFVSLGRILLDRGKPDLALAQFDHYLEAGHEDALAAEAWYGRSRGLSALGRAAEARESWSQLRTRYPDSAYADLAARHLAGEGTR